MPRQNKELHQASVTKVNLPTRTKCACSSCVGTAFPSLPNVFPEHAMKAYGVMAA
jgi:hypothetical protein